MKLTEVPTQRFIDNVTSITPGALKGGLIAVDRRPLKEKKLQKVPADTPGRSRTCTTRWSRPGPTGGRGCTRCTAR
jgi:hypothetical protein